MIKGIIFDFNGVIETRNFDEVVEKHALHRGYERDRIKIVLNEYFRGAFIGEFKDLEDFFTKGKPSLEVTLEEANEALEDIHASQQIDIRIIKLIEKLKPKYKIAILSNHGSILEDRLKNIFNIYHLFDLVVNSHDVGMAKPSPEIFTYTLDKLGIKPEEAIFIDDLKENVDGAEAVGIKGIHYKDFEEFKRELEERIPKPA